jgi:hypothetical protein
MVMRVSHNDYPKCQKEIHTGSIIANENTALLYYVVIKGGGHRSINFLHHWAVDPVRLGGVFYGKKLIQIAKNILEMVFCNAFQSLDPRILQKYFNLDDSESSTMLGLDILPPLYQGVSVGGEARKAFTLHCQTSVDSDLKEWPSIRSKQGQKEW